MSHKYDIAVIGAGAGGLTVTAGAAQLGLRTVLFESGEMGGDCLNVGCVPSKSLIAAAERAHVAAKAEAFGVDADPQVDFGRVMKHVHEVIAAIAPHDSAERFEKMGADVVRARARLTGGRTIEAGGETYRAKRIILATGSRPFVPDVPGLQDVSFLTNEIIWSVTEQPQHLIILGGGNVGVELAQAFRRLGSKVTIVEKNRIMANDDPDLVAVVQQALAAEGIAIYENATVERVRQLDDGVSVQLQRGDGVEGTHLLVATGRAPNVEDLGLDAAGVELGRSGIKVDARLRTSNRRIYAVGDCREGPRFTHAAGYDGGIAVRNAVFRMRAKADYSALPWCTFTDPELAQAGMTEARAREKHGAKVRTVEAPYEDNDRAQAERRTRGRIKLVLAGRKLVGCGIVGAHAGELIHPWALALSKGLSVQDMTGYIAPYPTLGEITKAGANKLFHDRLFSRPVRGVVGVLSKLP